MAARETSACHLPFAGGRCPALFSARAVSAASHELNFPFVVFQLYRLHYLSLING